jgi:hypothetical protein
MNAGEPRVRRRGFFLHSETAEADPVEVENPEGLVIRTRVRYATNPRHSGRFSSGRSRDLDRHEDESRPAIRSGSVTGSRQRAH